MDISRIPPTTIMLWVHKFVYSKGYKSKLGHIYYCNLWNRGDKGVGQEWVKGGDLL